MSGGGGANPTGGQFPAPVVAGLFGQSNQMFQPSPYPNTQQAASNAYGDIGSGFSNTAGAWSPWSQGSYGNALIGGGGNTINAGNQFLDQAGYQENAIGPGLGANIANANNLLKMLDPRITQTLNTGFDPQNKLFNQLFNQQQQQNLASQAAAGTANTPYGAGLTEQGNQNFDIAWQNAQLARQGQAAQNAASLAGIPSLDYANAMTLSGIPTAAAGIGNQTMGLGGQLEQAGAGLGQGAAGFLNNVNQQQIQDYLAYLSGSSSNAANLMNSTLGSLNAGTNLYGTQTGANAQQQGLVNQGLSGLGSGLGIAGGLGLANLFSGAGGGAAGGAGLNSLFSGLTDASFLA